MSGLIDGKKKGSALLFNMLCDKLENVLKERGKMQPTVSVIIPVYNIENYLANSLESVLNQSYQQLEIICVNDAIKIGLLR